jgi:hypothetical protein
MDTNGQIEEASEPHEHDAAAWAKHREAQRQPRGQFERKPVKSDAYSPGFFGTMLVNQRGPSA